MPPTDALLIAVAAVIVIAVVAGLSSRVRIAGLLVLLTIGLGISLLPFVPPVEVDPDIILVGILPPLLYSAAVRMPAVEFRRDLRAISALSVVLVIVSALALGGLFWLMIPSVGFPLGVALGAILSPTDAVATSIAKRLGLSARVVTILEGESLLNDATALVLLRTALLAVASGFSLGTAIGTFIFGVTVAVIIGGAVGGVMLRLRAWVGSSAAGTALSLTTPFLAYLPTEHLGGSGLVAAVAAGLVTGQGAISRFTPEQRLSERSNWRTIELVLEGAVFLVMGLELKEIVTANAREGAGVGRGIVIALAALALLLLVRAGFVALQLLYMRHRATRVARLRERLDLADKRLDLISERIERSGDAADRGEATERSRSRIERFRSQVRRGRADLDYYDVNALDGRHGTIIVWAGMRGVVTLAAAQTLPRSLDDRALLVLIAFTVALVSLMLQGLTLPWLVRRTQLNDETAATRDAATRDEAAKLRHELDVAGAALLAGPLPSRPGGGSFSPESIAAAAARFEQLVAGRDDPDDSTREHLELHAAIIEAMRAKLAQLGSGGGYSSAALRGALAELDADQLSVDRRLDEDEE